jgi:hypothetical protein
MSRPRRAAAEVGVLRDRSRTKPATPCLLEPLTPARMASFSSPVNLKSLRRSDAWEKAMQRAYADLSHLELDPPKDVGALRTLEANSAATYFRAWRSTPLRWRESSRHPIPEDWRAVGSRTSRFNLAGNRNASHPVNAILNYGYAVLQSQVQSKPSWMAMIRCSVSCTLSETVRRLSCST